VKATVPWYCGITAQNDVLVSLMSLLEIYFSSMVIPLQWPLLGYEVMYQTYVVLVGMCYFREEGNTSLPLSKIRLGRVLGPTKNEGNEMAQAMLLQNVIIVPQRTLRPLMVSELHSGSNKEIW